MGTAPSRWRLGTLGLCLLLFAYTGCAARQVCKDHERIRCCILQLLTDQIIDNLVRASNGLPIIQLDYSEMAATVTVEVNGSLDGANALKDTRKLTLATRALEVTREFSQGITKYSLGGKDTNQVVIRAVPVLNKDEVYNAYLEFLNEPGSLVVTHEPPPAGAAHVVKCCNDLYYWVPNEPHYKGLFLRLALVTTAQRGQPLAAPEPYFEATIKRIEQIKPNEEGGFELTAQLSKKIPSGGGVMLVTLGGTRYRFVVKRYAGDGTVQIPEGAPTDKIIVVLNAVAYPPLTDMVTKLKDQAPHRFGDQLLGQPLQIYLHDYRPTLRTTEDLLKGIQNRLDDIRLNQLR